MKYKDSQYQRQIGLINSSNIFNHSEGGGFFMGACRPFVLQSPLSNLYSPIRDKTLTYFSDNGVNWWRGSLPSGHTLSSQIACLNHLMPIMEDKDTVLSIINGIRNEFTDVLPIPCDTNPQYIAFEAVSSKDYLNEKSTTRGSNCTSVDALIIAKHISGKTILIPIEWKYTESYNNADKSVEGENNRKGLERQRRYNELITNSEQLVSLNNYESSVYYQEPFYQLMRQTLWAEQMVAHKEQEIIKADDFLHIHAVPSHNHTLLRKKYKVTGKDMEDSWRECLVDQSKYTIVDPSKLLAPLREFDKYKELLDYLQQRYW